MPYNMPYQNQLYPQSYANPGATTQQQAPRVQSNTASFGSASSVPGLTGQQMANPGRVPGAAPDANQGFRGYQEGLAELLQAQARGEAPFMSDLAFQRASDNNLRQQLALAASQRNNPGAMRLAHQGIGQFAGDTAADLASGRLAETRGAQGLLGQVAFQGRGLDIDVARANQAALLQQQQLNQAAQFQALGLQGQLAQAQAGMQAPPSQMDQLGNLFLQAGSGYLMTRPSGGYGGAQAPQPQYQGSPITYGPGGPNY